MRYPDEKWYDVKYLNEVFRVDSGNLIQYPTILENNQQKSYEKTYEVILNSNDEEMDDVKLQIKFIKYKFGTEWCYIVYIKDLLMIIKNSALIKSDRQYYMNIVKIATLKRMLNFRNVSYTIKLLALLIYRFNREKLQDTFAVPLGPFALISKIKLKFYKLLELRIYNSINSFVDSLFINILNDPTRLKHCYIVYGTQRSIRIYGNQLIAAEDFEVNQNE